MRYLEAEEVLEFNEFAVAMLSTKKADKGDLLSRQKLISVLDACEGREGDVFDKAAVLLAGIARQHPFASANRRTAVLATKEFLGMNGCKIGIKDDEEDSRVLQGIREGYYTHEEIKEWLKHGQVRKFER